MKLMNLTINVVLLNLTASTLKPIMLMNLTINVVLLI